MEGHVLPTVRIQKIEIENFKSVHYGEILFNCGRKEIPQDTESDILGIYGQNGSGKTSVIQAIAILRRAMSGISIPENYSECISSGAEYAKLTFVFDLQYPTDNDPFKRTITYSFKMDTVPNEINKEDSDTFTYRKYYPKKVRVFDETITASGMFFNAIQKKQVILSTSDNEYSIGPVRKIRYYVGEDKEAVALDLAVNKVTASKESKSFLFMNETLETFFNHSNYSEYCQVLLELHQFASFYLYAVDTRTSGIAAVSAIPLNTRYGVLPLNLLGASRMSNETYKDLETFVDNINVVLPSLIPDMKLEMNCEEAFLEDESKSGKAVKLFSRRADTIIPLRDESAGVIKLISVLSLITAAFNDRSITVAIDELDAGIFEYLLGEILESLEAYGKGQFIFTSHNLRPLEVLKKESIIFTTSNPENRYIRLKGVGRTNNLRNLYLRAILEHDQDEQIYNAAKKQKMIAAFIKAGKGEIDEEE